jgi:hypothetical protein
MARILVVALLVPLFIAGCREGDTTDCNDACKKGGEYFHTNACREILGEHRCVYICTTDSDCDIRWYDGCKSTSDDGTTICKYKAIEEVDSSTEQ